MLAVVGAVALMGTPPAVLAAQASGAAWHDGSIQHSTITTASVAHVPAPTVGALTGPGALGASPNTVTPGFHWVDGVMNQNAVFANCFGGFGADAAYTGYYTYTDSGGLPTGAAPQVGDIYYMHVVLGVSGNPCSGGDIPDIQVQLPASTTLAISVTNPMYCYSINSSMVVTNVSASAGCTSGAGTFLPVWLGYYGIASYFMYEVQFPVQTTAPLNGIDNPGSYLINTNTWAIGSFGSSGIYDYEPIYVPPVAVNATLTAVPPSTTTSTSASFSFTSNMGGSSFQCQLDGGSWAACASPKAYSGLALGVHTFHVVAIDTLGHVDPTPASYTWSIVSAAATHLSVTTVTSWTAGSGHSVVVKALDAYGNTATGYRGTIHFTSSDAHAVLPANYTFTAADNGTHTFSFAARLKTSGSQWIRATDTVSASITGVQSGIVVTAAAATRFSVATVTSWTAGSGHSVVVKALDAYGNTATGYRGTIHFTSSDAHAVLPANYTFTAADNGTHTFSFAARLKTSGSQWIRATDTVSASITGAQAGISVTPAAATHLAVTTVASWTAGSAHSVVVKALDAYGNTATGYRGTIHFTSSDAHAVLPSNYTFTAADNGTHTFSFATILKTAGSQWVRATDTVSASITGAQTGIVVT